MIYGSFYVIIKKTLEVNMLSKKPEHDRLSYEFMSIDELVPQDHLVRSIDRHIDFSFIYELVEPL